MKHSIVFQPLSNHAAEYTPFEVLDSNLHPTANNYGELLSQVMTRVLEGTPSLNTLRARRNKTKKDQTNTPHYWFLSAGEELTKIIIFA